MPIYRYQLRIFLVAVTRDSNSFEYSSTADRLSDRFRRAYILRKKIASTYFADLAKVPRTRFRGRSASRATRQNSSRWRQVSKRGRRRDPGCYPEHSSLHVRSYRRDGLASNGGDRTPGEIGRAHV